MTATAKQAQRTPGNADDFAVAGNRFRVRTESVTLPHETMRVFANGGSAGLLTMRLDEAQTFRDCLQAHDELVAALRSVCGVFEGYDDAPIYVLKCRAALKRATGE